MLHAREAQQAQVLRQLLTETGITVDQLWWQYFSLGGDVSRIEVDAYLHQALHLPRFHRDLLDHAAHEFLDA